MVLHGFDVYRTYLAMKLHFTQDKFDFFQYDGKANAKEETYQQRNDFYFFETLARKLNKKEVVDFMLASFIFADNPSKVWIGDIKHSGKERWLEWTKRQQSMTYLFEQDIDNIHNFMLKNDVDFNQLFSTEFGHPPLLKLHIKNKISTESLIILDIVLKYIGRWNKDLHDPLWENLSFKIKKYKPFLSIPSSKYKKTLKEKFL